MIITLVTFAFFFGILISLIGLPPMVGFLVAGFAYNFAGLEVPKGLQNIADLGVTLLLFSIGLKLELKYLTNMGISSFNLYKEAGEGLAREALNVIN